MPPVVGWAAITGGLDLPALYLFAIIFFWTPPHFWALSLLLKNDYAEAGVPMLPVVAGERATAKAILMHSLILVAISLIFITAQAVGWVYALSAAMLGAVLLFYVARLLRDQTKRAAKQLYLYSLLYLALLFTAVMVDSSVNLVTAALTLAPQDTHGSPIGGGVGRGNTSGLFSDSGILHGHRAHGPGIPRRNSHC